MKLTILLSLSFFSAYSYSQQYLWADTIQFENDHGVTALANDGEQNIYVASTQFYVGTSLLFSYYCGDIHLRKYDADGNQLWEDIFPGFGRIFDLQIDNDGNIVACGGYVQTLTIDGETFTTPMFITGSFLVKLNPFGDVIWKQATEPPVFNTVMFSITTDNANNIYAVGLEDDITALLKKFNSDGEEINSEDMLAVRTSSDIEIDADGNIFVAGCCPDYATFDGIPLPDEAIGSGYSNYLVKYDSSFNAVDVRGVRYFTFDFNPALSKNTTGIFWRCTAIAPVGFDQNNLIAHYDFLTGDLDTVRLVDESFGIFTQFIESPGDSKIFILENEGINNKILQINYGGETVDSLIYYGLHSELETFDCDNSNIWTAGYIYDSLVLDTITLYPEEGDFYQPFVSRFGPVEEDTITEDTCNAYFEYFIDGDQIIHFTNLSTGSDSSEIISWLWTFCDGDSSFAWDATHPIAFDESVCACLTITDVTGCTDEYCVDESNSILTNDPSLFTIFPNPVSESEITITSDGEFMVTGMFDLQGNQIQFQTSQTNSNTVVLQFSVESGIYFIRIQNEKNVVIKKINVQ